MRGSEDSALILPWNEGEVIYPHRLHLLLRPHAIQGVAEVVEAPVAVGRRVRARMVLRHESLPSIPQLILSYSSRNFLILQHFVI